MAPVWLQQAAGFLNTVELPALIIFLFLSFLLKKDRRGCLILAGMAAVIFMLALCGVGILLYTGQTFRPLSWPMFLEAILAVASVIIARRYFLRAKGLR